MVCVCRCSLLAPDAEERERLTMKVERVGNASRRHNSLISISSEVHKEHRGQRTYSRRLRWKGGQAALYSLEHCRDGNSLCSLAIAYASYVDSDERKPPYTVRFSAANAACVDKERLQAKAAARCRCYVRPTPRRVQTPRDTSV